MQRVACWRSTGRCDHIVSSERQTKKRREVLWSSSPQERPGADYAFAHRRAPGLTSREGRNLGD